MEPMTLPALREVAIKNGSVNVHLATHWNLRWHDPFWLAAWQRWQDARNAWARVWPCMDFKFIKPSIFEPDPSIIPEPTQAAAALEYMEARKAYLAANKLYAGDTDG
jgi:hypothetical protein